MLYAVEIEKLSDLKPHWYDDEPWFETRQVSRLLGMSINYASLFITKCIIAGKRRVGRDDSGAPATLINGDGLVEVWANIHGKDYREAAAYVNTLEPEKRRYTSGAMYKIPFGDDRIETARASAGALVYGPEIKMTYPLYSKKPGNAS